MTNDDPAATLRHHAASVLKTARVDFVDQVMKLARTTDFATVVCQAGNLSAPKHFLR